MSIIYLANGFHLWNLRVDINDIKYKQKDKRIQVRRRRSYKKYEFNVLFFNSERNR